MVDKVCGSLTAFDGRVHLDEQNPGQSTAQIVIKVHSTDTGNPDRDSHLRGNDFFAMDEFPEITFTTRDRQRTRSATSEPASRARQRSTARTSVSPSTPPWKPGVSS
jgi:polyisoprenoid-binding protein YceI